MHELSRYGQRVWLKVEHIIALAIPKHERKGSVQSYSFGGCVLLTSKHINYRTLLSSIDGLKRQVQSEHKLKIDKESKNGQTELE